MVPHMLHSFSMYTGLVYYCYNNHRQAHSINYAHCFSAKPGQVSKCKKTKVEKFLFYSLLIDELNEIVLIY